MALPFILYANLADATGATLTVSATYPIKVYF